MRFRAVAGLAFQITVLSGVAALAATSDDPYKITAKEKAACTSDAIRYCAYTYPNEGELLSCMKTNRSSLSAMCLAAFDAGMRKRRLE